MILLQHYGKLNVADHNMAHCILPFPTNWVSCSIFVCSFCMPSSGSVARGARLRDYFVHDLSEVFWCTCCVFDIPDGTN